MIPKIVENYRAGLVRGELLIQQCKACQKFNMYPRYACPHCQSEDLGWKKASGKGTLMSWTVLRAGGPEGFETEVPYALGVVKLEEGVQLLGRLANDASGDWQSYRCDMSVKFEAASPEQMATRPAAWFTAA
ncbi:MAG: Zn-ribbon domain-containing OB-fold protein [Panacagrimonas sp.]